MRLLVAIVMILVAAGLLISGSMARRPETRGAVTPEREQIERAIEIVQYARYSHVYWWERLEWDSVTPIESVGDREFQARWIAYYDYVLETLYGMLGTTYYGYDYGHVRANESP
ncbi:MAG: hypothetical protein HYX84_06160 [Chloroflexi bacterium]|nr:hypothetical protein [Chloroflexota bacterium]